MFPNSVDVVIDDRLEPDTVLIELGLSIKLNLSQMRQGLFMQLRRNKNQSTEDSDKVAEWSVGLVEWFVQCQSKLAMLGHKNQQC